MSSRRLSHQDCIPLLEEFQARLSGWKCSLLSFAGRLELIKSTLTALHIYWASTYLLHQSFLNTIDRLMRDFFWNKWNGKYTHPITWRTICKPIDHGGLGIQSVVILNQDTIIKYVWKVAVNCSKYMWVYGK